MKRTSAIFLGFLLAVFPSVAAPENGLTHEDRQNHILFPNGGATLDQAARAQIALLGQILSTRQMSSACLQLKGYSDATGGDAINLKISQARAEAVATALAEVLEDAERIQAVEGAGAQDFLASLLPTDRYQRRVAIFAKDCDVL